MPGREDSMGAAERAAARIDAVTPIIGLEVHVELATRSKMFAAAPNPAWVSSGVEAANTALDAVVLGLPGALPVMNALAVELSARVGLALGCSIAPVSVWDRKSYMYPDLPKGYQISQYALPLCFDGEVTLPAIGGDGAVDWRGSGRRVGIVRAHLEEDAGKLLHEAPGGGTLEFTIVDLNRAGVPLLEVVTQPDLRSAAEAVAFCRVLRWVCRWVGATHGVLQRGHMRFEPNINCELRLADGRVVRTPIVEVKNLNSFRAVAGAIEHEIAEQPARWRETGREHGPGSKSTRGWDDVRGVTVPQREKEDAQDYRYFPDPDLPAVRVERDWVEGIRSGMPPDFAATIRRYVADDGLSEAEALALAERRADAALFDDAVARLTGRGVGRAVAVREVANVLLQHGARLVNEDPSAEGVADLGIDAEQVAGVAAMRHEQTISAANALKLLERLRDPAMKKRDLAAIAEYEGLLAVRDAGLLAVWCDEVIAANGAIVEQVRGGKAQAVGRLIGEVMKRSGGSADAASVRAMLVERINAG